MYFCRGRIGLWWSRRDRRHWTCSFPDDMSPCSLPCESQRLDHRQFKPLWDRTVKLLSRASLIFHCAKRHLEHLKREKQKFKTRKSNVDPNKKIAQVIASLKMMRISLEKSLIKKKTLICVKIFLKTKITLYTFWMAFSIFDSFKKEPLMSLAL